MARATFVKKAQKDNEEAGIKKGDSYYWWEFRYGGKRYSKTAPSRSQLTQSGFLSTLYSIEDNSIANFTADTVEEFNDNKESLRCEIEELREECQSSLDNMPDHLQESSSSGQMLTERIEALEEWESEIENIEVDWDGDEDASRDDNEELATALDSAIEEIQTTGSNL